MVKKRNKENKHRFSAPAFKWHCMCNEPMQKARRTNTVHTTIERPMNLLTHREPHIINCSLTRFHQIQVLFVWLLFFSLPFIILFLSFPFSKRWSAIKKKSCQLSFKRRSRVLHCHRTVSFLFIVSIGERGIVTCCYHCNWLSFNENETKATTTKASPVYGSSNEFDSLEKRTNWFTKLFLFFVCFTFINSHISSLESAPMTISSIQIGLNNKVLDT